MITGRRYRYIFMKSESCSISKQPGRFFRRMVLLERIPLQYTEYTARIKATLWTIEGFADPQVHPGI